MLITISRTAWRGCSRSSLISTIGRPVLPVHLQRYLSTMTTATPKKASTSSIGGVEVPSMAIGTWAWGSRSGPWKEDPDGENNVRSAWEACNNVGLTFYDTAEIYTEGESEKMIGKLLKETSPEIRSKVYIATKYLPIPRPANWFLFTPGVVAACQKSLKRLGVEKIDLYQIHGNVGLHSIEAVGRELAKCYNMGLCKAVGVSNYNEEELVKMVDVLAEYNVPLASNQVEFSLLRRLPESTGLLAEMKKRDIALLAYSPLGMGRLTGKYSSANPVPSGRRFGDHYTWEQLNPLLDTLRTMATMYEVPVSAIALNWVISKGCIPLGGARNAKQAEENAKATLFRLSDEDVKVLDGMAFEGKTSWWQHG